MCLAESVNGQSVQERMALSELRDLAIKKEIQAIYGTGVSLFVSGNEISTQLKYSSPPSEYLQKEANSLALQILWNANYGRGYGGVVWNFEYVHVTITAYSELEKSEGEAIVRLSDYGSKEALSAACDRVGLKTVKPPNAKAVAANDQIAKAEKELQMLWNRLTPLERTNLKNDELAWIKVKDASKDNDEKLRMILERIEFLKKYVPHS
jgi:hypothetical protein